MPLRRYSARMSNAHDILIVGSRSRIATALAPLLGQAASFVGRSPRGGVRETIVAGYDAVPWEAFDGARCVINCVGVSTGTADMLASINVDVACQLARRAKAAGVRHFIHISSFSVYGHARSIDRTTPSNASSAYGRSKLKADLALLAMADPSFAVTVLRLPLIYAVQSMGKLGRLLRLWSRMKVMPVPRGDVARAMIGVEMIAEIIVRLAKDPETGIVFAADPRPFTYADAARARGNGRGWRRVTIPQPIAQAVERLSPRIGGRLFGDSRLADRDNLSIRYGLTSRLYRDIAAAIIA